jgi:hypothetical protein
MNVFELARSRCQLGMTRHWQAKIVSAVLSAPTGETSCSAFTCLVHVPPPLFRHDLVHSTVIYHDVDLALPVHQS